MHNDSATMANVASQNTLVDDGVGRVLPALREKGLDKNTLVIFSSDQGNFYGQHGIWQHTIVTTPSSMYETAMNIPLIIRHPDKIEAGRTSDLLIGQYDIPVTILDYTDCIFTLTPNIESYHRDYPAVVFLGLRFPDQVCQGRVTGIGQLDAVFPTQQVQDAAAADCGAVHGQQHRVNLIKVHGIQ